MATKKEKAKKTAQDFSTPFSVLLFNKNMRNIEAAAMTSGMAKTVLIRLAIDHADKTGFFKKFAS